MNDEVRHFKVTLTSSTGKEFNFFYDATRSTQALLAAVEQGGYIANIVNAKVEEV